MLHIKEGECDNERDYNDIECSKQIVHEERVQHARQDRSKHKRSECDEPYVLHQSVNCWTEIVFKQIEHYRRAGNILIKRMRKGAQDKKVKSLFNLKTGNF